MILLLIILPKAKGKLITDTAAVVAQLNGNQNLKESFREGI
jgi:hypothetical protein